MLGLVVINVMGILRKEPEDFTLGKTNVSTCISLLNSRLRRWLTFHPASQISMAVHNQATTEPVFLVSADTTPVSPYPVWGYDEVLGIPTDGSQIVYRMGQTLNTGTSQYFICQNSIMGISQDGHDAYFTSDMGGNGVLGYEADGVIPRCDVFKLTLPY